MITINIFKCSHVWFFLLVDTFLYQYMIHDTFFIILYYIFLSVFMPSVKYTICHFRKCFTSINIHFSYVSGLPLKNITYRTYTSTSTEYHPSTTVHTQAHPHHHKPVSPLVTHPSLLNLQSLHSSSTQPRAFTWWALQFPSTTVPVSYSSRQLQFLWATVPVSYSSRNLQFSCGNLSQLLHEADTTPHSDVICWL